MRESTQRKLDRVRPPRVHLIYDVESGGAVSRREIPFVVGILAGLSGYREDAAPPLRERKFVDVDFERLPHVLAMIRPRLRFSVDDVLGKNGSQLTIDLTVCSLEDFEPERIVARVPSLGRLLEARAALWKLREMNGDPDRLASGIDRVIEPLKLPRLPSSSSGTSADAVILELDRLLSNQLDIILHHPDFRRLEATWRGVQYLVAQTETSPSLQIRLLDVSKEELARDLSKASEFDQSGLFRKIYEEEYGTLGGAPFGALVGDYEFSCEPADVALLRGVAGVAMAAHAPFIASASPGMFGVSHFGELAATRDLGRLFETPDYAAWRAFRDLDEAGYVGLTMPRILMRRPYAGDTSRREAFSFSEHTSDDGAYPWGNSAYAFGVCLTNAFAKYGWCATIRGHEGGGLVEGLPVHVVKTEDGELALKCPTEVAIADRREKEVADLGFIPLVHLRGSDNAAFFSAPSCQRPRTYDTDLANANARLSTQLPYILTTSRFAHYIKALVRDKIGSFIDRGQCELFLNAWISNYVLLEDAASSRDKARRPLREARVDVTETPGRPGSYSAVVFLRPRFQLDELSVSIRMVVALPIFR